MRKLLIADNTENDVVIITSMSAGANDEPRATSYVFAGAQFQQAEFSWSDVTFEPVPKFDDMSGHGTLGHVDLLLLKATWVPQTDISECRFITLCEGYRWLVQAQQGRVWYVARAVTGLLQWHGF